MQTLAKMEGRAWTERKGLIASVYQALMEQIVEVYTNLCRLFNRFGSFINILVHMEPILSKAKDGDTISLTLIRKIALKQPI